MNQLLLEQAVIEYRIKHIFNTPHLKEKYLAEYKKQTGVGVVDEGKFRDWVKSAWSSAKYAASKAGRFDQGGSIFGRDKAKKAGREKYDKASASVEANKIVGKFWKDFKDKYKEFPNMKSQEEFFQSLQEFGVLYDSLVAAAEKKEIDADEANKIIASLRDIVQVTIDNDLASVYVPLNENDIDLSQIEIITEQEEEKNQFTKKSKSQVEDDTDYAGETETNKNLKSNTLPLVLAGLGALGVGFGWLIQQPWFIAMFKTPDIITDITKVIREKNGITQQLALLNGNPTADYSNMKVADFFADMKKHQLIDASNAPTKNLLNIANEAGNSKFANWWSTNLLNADPNATLSKVIPVSGAGAAGAGGDVLTSKVLKTITKSLVKTGASALAASGAAAIAGPALVLGGITLLAGGALVKALRVKGLKSSRSQLLSTLLNQLKDVKSEGGDEEGGGEQPPKGPNSTGATNNKLLNAIQEFASDTTVEGKFKKIVKTGDEEREHVFKKQAPFTRKQILDDPQKFLDALSPEEKMLLLRLPDNPNVEPSKVDFFRMTTDERKEMYNKVKTGRIDFGANEEVDTGRNKEKSKKGEKERGQGREYKLPSKAKETKAGEFQISDLRDILRTGHTRENENEKDSQGKKIIRKPIPDEKIRSAQKAITSYLSPYLKNAGVTLRESQLDTISLGFINEINRRIIQEERFHYKVGQGAVERKENPIDKLMSYKDIISNIEKQLKNNKYTGEVKDFIQSVYNDKRIKEIFSLNEASRLDAKKSQLNQISDVAASILGVKNTNRLDELTNQLKQLFIKYQTDFTNKKEGQGGVAVDDPKTKEEEDVNFIKPPPVDPNKPIKPTKPVDRTKPVKPPDERDAVIGIPKPPTGKPPVKPGPGQELGKGEAVYVYQKGGKDNTSLTSVLMGLDLPNWAVKDLTDRIKKELEANKFIVKESIVNRWKILANIK